MNWIDLEAFDGSEFEDVIADGLIIIDPTEFESRRSFVEKILINLFAQIRAGNLRRMRLITRLGHFRVTPLSRLKFWKRRVAFLEATNKQSRTGRSAILKAQKQGRQKGLSPSITFLLVKDVTCRVLAGRGILNTDR